VEEEFSYHNVCRMVENGRMEASALEKIKVIAKDITEKGEHMPKGIELHVILQGKLTAAHRRQLMAAG
jgi:primase-polymerase (primpol)-like protein